jgi:hypothetical protein
MDTTSKPSHGKIHGALWFKHPCEASLVQCVVGWSDWRWCQGLEGTIRKAIEVKMDGQTVYVDNQDGKALVVFLEGRAPLPGFRFVPAFAVYGDPDAKPSYQARLE